MSLPSLLSAPLHLVVPFCPSPCGCSRSTWKDIKRRAELIAEQAPPVVRTEPAETMGETKPAGAENPSAGFVSGGGKIGGELHGEQRRSHSPRVGFTPTWESADEAGKTPLEERPWKHSKYYKVRMRSAWIGRCPRVFGMDPRNEANEAWSHEFVSWRHHNFAPLPCEIVPIILGSV